MKKKGKKQNTRNISLNIHRRFQLIDRGPTFSFSLRREREGENGKYNDHRAQEKQEKKNSWTSSQLSADDVAAVLTKEEEEEEEASSPAREARYE